MPITVKCSFCNKAYKVRDDLAGKAVLCKECGAQLRVPGGDGSLEVTDFLEDEEDAGGSYSVAGDGDQDEWEKSLSPVKSGGRKPVAKALPPRRVAPTKKTGRSSGNNQAALWILGGGAAALLLVIILIVALVSGGRNPAPEVANNNPPANPPANPAPFQPNVPVPGNNPGAPPANPGFPAAFPNPGANALPQPVAPSGFQPPGNAVNQTAKNWKVAIDPSSEKFENPAADKIRITIPKTLLPEVIYPDAPSPFVAVGSNTGDTDVREIRNAATNELVGSIRGVRFPSAKAALASDGLHFAVLPPIGKGITVFDVKAQRALGELPFDKGAFPKYFGFAGKDRLVAANSNGQMSVWAIPSGNPEGVLALPNTFRQESIAFSPGGKFIALIDGDHQQLILRGFDLTTRSSAGDITLTGTGRNQFECRAIAFSPDGAEIAALFEHGANEAALYVFDVAKGKLDKRMEFRHDLRSKYRGNSSTDRVLEWFPDRKRWLLYSMGIFDRGTGQLVYNLPEVDSSGDWRLMSVRRILGNDQLLVVTGDRDNMALVSAGLSSDDIAKSAAVVAAGGMASDASLPPLTPANLAAARTISVEGGGARWSVQPDPAHGLDKKLLPKPLELKPTAAKLEAAVLSNAEAARGVILYSNSNSNSQNRRPATTDAARKARDKIASKKKKEAAAPPAGDQPSAPNWLEVIDLADGKPIKSVDVPFAADLLALSPDGTRVLLRLKDGESRLDVWSVETDEHVVAWRPYQSEKQTRDQKIKAAGFIDSEHVLTINAEDKLVLWELPSCKATYVMEKVRNAGISPNRRYLALSNGKAYRLFESLTGEAKGDFVLEGGAPAAAAFHPDGSRFAATFNDFQGDRFICWNLQDGKVETEFYIPQAGRTMHWCGDKHLLLDNDKLISLDHKMIVWRYQLPSGVHIFDSPDARHWFLTSSAGRNSSIHLAAASLPDSQTVAKLRSADPKPDLIVGPGTKLSIRFNFTSKHPTRTTLDQDVYKNLLDKFAKNDVSVAEGQSLTLYVSMAQRNTGKTNEFQITQIGGGGGQQKISLPETFVDCTFQIFRGDKEVWQTKSSSSNFTFSFIVPQGKTPEQALTENMWEQAANYLLNFAPPKYIFAATAANGLGSSQLTADGGK